jgi:nucleoside-diphosphate-sugar epimerase
MLELFKLAKWGVVPMPPQGRASLIHVEDLARLLLALVPAREDVTRQVFEPDDGKRDGWSHRELAKAIGWALGRRPWVPHLSRPVLEQLARLDKALRGDKAKLTPDRVGYMTHPDWVCTPRMRPPTGLWMPEVATLDGLRTTAKWYREQGWL